MSELATCTTVSFAWAFGLAPSSTITSANAVGRLVFQSNAVNADRHYSYDAVGRTVFEQGYSPNNPGATSNPISATYDLAGSMTSLTYPDGRIVSYGYDAGGRMTSVTDNTNSAATIKYEPAIQYGPAGRITGASFGNGLNLAQSFDTRLRPQSLTYTITSTQPIQHPEGVSPQAAAPSPTYKTLWSKQYGWTASGNLQLSNDSVLGIARQYTYDTLNRLTSAQDIAGSMASTGESTNTQDGSQDNALVSSQNLGGNSWGVSNAIISANSTTSPDGSFGADRILHDKWRSGYWSGWRWGLRTSRGDDCLPRRSGKWRRRRGACKRK